MDLCTVDNKLEDLARKYGLRLRTRRDYDRRILHYTFISDSSLVSFNRSINIMEATQSDFDEIENSLRKLADKITNHMKLIVNSVYGAGMDRNRTIWKWDPDRLCSVIDKSTSRDNELVEFKPQWMRTFGEKGVNRGAADELKRITKKLGYGGDFDGDTVSKVTITGGLTMHTNFEIKNVIFNDPATIVFWADGSKTIVKAENDGYDPEKGLAMAIAKKALGNKGNYYNTIKKWLPVEKAVNNADGKN